MTRLTGVASPTAPRPLRSSLAEDLARGRVRVRTSEDLRAASREGVPSRDPTGSHLHSSGSRQHLLSNGVQHHLYSSGVQHHLYNSHGLQHHLHNSGSQHHLHRHGLQRHLFRPGLRHPGRSPVPDVRKSKGCEVRRRLAAAAPAIKRGRRAVEAMKVYRVLVLLPLPSADPPPPLEVPAGVLPRRRS